MTYRAELNEQEQQTVNGGIRIDWQKIRDMTKHLVPEEERLQAHYPEDVQIIV